MKYFILLWSLVCVIGMAYGALVIYPRKAASMNRYLPERRSLLDRIFAPFSDRFDSPQAMMQVRFSGLMFIGTAILIVALIVWWAVSDVTGSQR